MIGVDQTNLLESIYDNFMNGNKEDVAGLIDGYGVDFWEGRCGVVWRCRQSLSPDQGRPARR
jgi:hypothetical protein